MRECPICRDPVKAWDAPRKSHLIITKDINDHVHSHGDLEKPEEMQSLLLEAASTTGAVLATSAKKAPKEVIFHNRQRIGDMLMFTCGVRDYKKMYPDSRVNVMATAMHIWDNNPYIDRSLEQWISPEVCEEATAKAMKPLDYITTKHFPEHTNIVKIGPSWLTNASNRMDWHFANAYRVSIEQALGLPIQQGLSRPDVWLTEDEYNAPRVTKDPYWIICTGGEFGWGCKMYPHEKWQEFVDQNPDILFYQIGAAGDFKPGKNGRPAMPKLTGKNVVDYVGKTEDKQTGIRDLYKLFLNAEGSIGLVSFHMHLSGALWKPAVVVAGGREPVSFTRYEGHRYLSNDGALPCAVQACWACSIEEGDTRCKNIVEHPDRFQKRVPKCADMITPDEITAALRMYYRGGRLVAGVASERTPKKLLNPLVKAPATPAAPAKGVSELQERITRQYGTRHPFKFGGGSPTENDWLFISKLIDDHKVKTVLEFGIGLSTLLISEKAQVTSYETMGHWIERLKLEKQGLDIRKWDGKDTQLDEKVYDLAFVDGPSGGVNREHSVRLASKHAKMVIVHDGQFAPEQGWQTKYLRGVMEGPVRGGDRCHLWTSKNGNGFHASQPKAKTIKIVSTARGWGGCARSVTTIMKMLLQAGHKVEFIPFRNAVGSREYRACIENELGGLSVNLDYAALKDSCDVLLVYADDFVWEFPHCEEMFSGLKAKRKVMMVNYRRGKIGEVPWTKGWDLYAFLNSGQRKDLLKVLPEAKTEVLPPCTDLMPFFKVRVDYKNGLRVVRHNSQGDTKFVSDKEDPIECGRVVKEIETVLERPDASINMLPGPSFVPEADKFKKFQRTSDPNVIANFLSKGNVFWYSLPKGYQDMGPRVILEAMAAGLPIVADKWGGAVDRVTPETGWLCETKEEQLEILKTVTPEELQMKGEAARRRANANFVPEKWLELLVDA